MYGAYVVISLFVLQPVLEYGVHRALHSLHERWHIGHHLTFVRGTYWLYQSHKAIWLTAAVLLCARRYILAGMLIKHEIAHWASHRLPWLKHMHRHHFLHHRMPDKNFGFSAIWPDRIFGTLSP